MRECDCPDWVIRCSHWDGNALWLASFGETYCCKAFEPSNQFAVYMRSVAVDCEEHNGKLALIRWLLLQDPRFYTGDSEEEALAAFYAAEGRILREEVAIC